MAVAIASPAMRLVVPIFLLLVACGEPPVFEATRVTPARFVSALGEELLVEGEGLERLQSASLRQGATMLEVPVASVEASHARLKVAPGLATGLWDLRLSSREGETIELKGVVESIDGELQIEILNVGQGDAGYVRAPGGETLVIDGGRARTRHGPDSIAPVLKARSIQPDYILVSHFDADHLGGVVDYLRGDDGVPCTGDDRLPLLGLLDYATGWSTCGSALCQDYYDLRDCNAARMAAPQGWRVPAAGWKLRLGPGTDVTVVAVNGQLSDGRVVATGSDNANSIAVVVEYGGFRYFTAGDLTGGQQGDCQVGADTADVETLVGEVVGPVDVLHVNHHGSCTSTNQAFLQSLEPAVALISVGENNSYGHPAQAVLDRLDEAGAVTYLTTPGITQPERFPLTVLPPSAEPRTGHLRITSGDGRRYAVEVLGSPSSRRTFDTRSGR